MYMYVHIILIVTIVLLIFGDMFHWAGDYPVQEGEVI